MRDYSYEFRIDTFCICRLARHSSSLSPFLSTFFFSFWLLFLSYISYSSFSILFLSFSSLSSLLFLSYSSMTPRWDIQMTPSTAWLSSSARSARTSTAALQIKDVRAVSYCRISHCLSSHRHHISFFSCYLPFSPSSPISSTLSSFESHFNAHLLHSISSHLIS